MPHGIGPGPGRNTRMSARARAMKKAKKADGGSVKGVEVPGAFVMKEAESADDGFKRGGKPGVEAHGGKGHKRMDKAPRKAAGGAVKLARGGSVYSAANKVTKSAPDKGSECD